MAEDLMNFDLPVERSSIIKVIGIGGGGSNAVNHMFRQGIKELRVVLSSWIYHNLLIIIASMFIFGIQIKVVNNDRR